MGGRYIPQPPSPAHVTAAHIVMCIMCTLTVAFGSKKRHPYNGDTRVRVYPNRPHHGERTAATTNHKRRIRGDTERSPRRAVPLHLSKSTGHQLPHEVSSHAVPARQCMTHHTLHAHATARRHLRTIIINRPTITLTVH